MEAAEALDGDDRAAEQRRAAASTASRRRSAARRRRLDEPHRGPQSGQALGCAWKRRSRGSSYSRPAGRAHLESGHRRVRPVVGDVAHDREARAAVRAVDERVAKAAVAGSNSSARQSAQVALSGVTAAPRLAAVGLSRIEKPRSPAPRPARRSPAPPSRAAAPGRKPGEEALHRLGRRLDLDHHAARVVEHVPARRARPPAGRRRGESPPPEPFPRPAPRTRLKPTSSRSRW